MSVACDVEIKEEIKEEPLNFGEENGKDDQLVNEASNLTKYQTYANPIEAIFLPENIKEEKLDEDVESEQDNCNKQASNVIKPQLSDNYVKDEPDHESQNPWPHLEDYFIFKKRDKRNPNILYFECVLCQPKNTTIRGHATSLSNLKSHVKRSHAAQTIQFEERIKAGCFRGKRRQFSCISASSSRNSSTSSQSTPSPAKKICQQVIGEAFEQLVAGTDVHQSVVDSRIEDLFVSNMLPLHVVESETFVNLIQTLNSSKTSMSRLTLGNRILARHKQLEGYLIRLLKDVPWVATTADCWSVHNRSYIGITAHWLDPKSRKRQHAVLACSLLSEHPTYDVLAKAMVDTYNKFHLQDKVTRTTMDNAKNFFKTFVQFGSEAELLPCIPEPAADPDTEGFEDMDLNVYSEAGAGAADEVEYISVEATFEESSDLGHNLPAHMRCAAHTFNLVASLDADKALDSVKFKSAYLNSMSKAQALWNQQNRCSLSADYILDEIKKKLVVPNSTRWNSTYYSVAFLNNLLEKERETVHKVMARLELQVFTDSEVIFLKEYAQVMSIVVKALDKIQGGFYAYLGSLLPIVAATIMKLKETKSKGLLYCGPLVYAILAGIMKRFGPLLQDQECQLASAFHPMFRLVWLERHDNSQLSRVKEAMETVVETAMRETIEECSSTTSIEDDEDDFFSGITQPQESRSHRSLKFKAQNLVKAWLKGGSKNVMNDVTFLCEQVLIDLFIKYNTAIPSSTAFGHLFSIGKDILRAKRNTTLPDTNFERMMFMKGNNHHIETMEKEEEAKQGQ